MSTDFQAFNEISERSREIFRRIVEAYLETGEPVGSKTISARLPMSLSPASIRNVMSDLEARGLVQAPHTSAGRMPTDQGLRMFVDGMLEIGDLPQEERRVIETQFSGTGRDLEDALTDATRMLSGLSHCAGVVLASKTVKVIRHVEFVALEPGKALVVLVAEDGSVENRVIDTPPGLTPSALIEAANYLNTHITGCTLQAARRKLRQALDQDQRDLDQLAAEVIKTGIAEWSGHAEDKTLIVRGQANLLEDMGAAGNLERIRTLFEDLERKKDLIQLLGLAENADGVRIFIGSENNLFSLSGSSIIAAPYHDAERRIIGVLGIIGPTRLNYARIVPIVDYTAQVLSRFLP
ncbi:MAG: heat-inducible transcriptional repressor HrcA [Hyphomicrobiales bacterium]|nr:MAG: heat-inducible transcriptional repressor HrcA [Hyphomicrobiales bacterium]